MVMLNLMNCFLFVVRLCFIQKYYLSLSNRVIESRLSHTGCLLKLLKLIDQYTT